MEHLSSHSEEIAANKTATKDKLFSNKKKLEFLAHHFDPADFPPSDEILPELLKEFGLKGEDPFAITNKILILLDKTLEAIEREKND